MEKLDPAVRRQLLQYFMIATAYGDALGASTEFRSVPEAVAFTVQHRGEGFPWKPVGKGWLSLPAGAHTDDTDMALAIARSYVESKASFDPLDVAKRWVDWLNTNPPDVGVTIRTVLGRTRDGEDPFEASAQLFAARPGAAANGALMRNAVCSVIAGDLQQAFLCSLLQGIMTHYHPLSVLCCAVQTWLIREYLDGRDPFFKYDDWMERWHEDWTRWVVSAKHERATTWLERVEHEGALDKAMDTLCSADFDPDAFNPFAIQLGPQQGYVLVSLQIAVWAMQWSQRPAKAVTFPVTGALKSVADVFERRGLHTIGWMPLIGHDADTYGAIAAPLIISAIGKPVSSRYTSNLAIRDEEWLFGGGPPNVVGGR